jgi:hypothetical protein
MGGRLIIGSISVRWGAAVILHGVSLDMPRSQRLLTSDLDQVISRKIAVLKAAGTENSLKRRAAMNILGPNYYSAEITPSALSTAHKTAKAP